MQKKITLDLFRKDVLEYFGLIKKEYSIIIQRNIAQ
jgi:hypothetical protein